MRQRTRTGFLCLVKDGNAWWLQAGGMLWYLGAGTREEAQWEAYERWGVKVR